MTKQQLIDKLMGDYYEHLLSIGAEDEISSVKESTLKKHTKEQLLLVHRLLCILKELLEDIGELQQVIITAHSIGEVYEAKALVNKLLDAMLVCGFLSVDWMEFKEGDDKRELIKITKEFIKDAGTLGEEYHNELAI